MSRSTKISVLQGIIKRQKERSPQTRSENSTAIHLLEQQSGIRAGGNGDTMPDVKRKLMESTMVHLQLITEGVASGKTIARGEFGRCDVPTQNGRIYPQRLMEREIARLMGDIKRRSVLGELDHPIDGRTSLKRVSHVITGLKIKDGIVIGECEILNTPEGKTLKALIEANVQVGVSSRGYGSTAPAKGQQEGEEVQEDFVLKTYDFVADPAMRSAVPGIYTEDVDDETLANMFLSEFPEIAESIKIGSAPESLEEGVDAKKQERKEIEESIRAELTERFEKQLLSSLLEMRREVDAELREEFSNDPSLGGAKAMLASIAEMVGAYRSTPSEKAVADALKAKELEVSEALAEKDRALKEGAAATHMLVIEKKIGKHPMADSIRKLLSGRVFESEAAALEAVDTVISELPDAGEVITKEEAKYREENAELRGNKTLLESKVAELNDKLLKAATLTERIDEQRISKVEEAQNRVAELEEKLETVVSESQKIVEEAQAQLSEARKLQEDAEIRAYKLEKVAGIVNGGELLGLMEGVSDRTVVDKLVMNRGLNTMSDPGLERARQSVLKKGEVSKGMRLDEDTAVGTPSSSNELGDMMSEMALLAGIPAKR